MNTNTLQLYVDHQFLSPYALSAFVALQVKQIPFTLHTLNLAAGEHQQAAFAHDSLSARVPMLQHGDFCLSESSAIAEYLDENWPGAALYPRDPQQKARARQIQAWLRSDLMPIRNERSTEVVFIQPSTQPLSNSAQQAAAKLFAAAEQLIDEAGGPLFGQWCIADVDLALMLKRLINNGDAVPEKLARYAAQQWQHPAIALWLQQQRGG
ncbi:glutathione transferase [Chitinibacter sp. SCUT-21]|uniref:glutathione transferase n=1 Tax=Chitinibacter sp. SCUT-21 TaxID=2970891 RepID=UPI0035A69F50